MMRQLAVVDTVTRDDLEAYVDGELESERRQRVADYLAHTPEAARMVDEIASLNGLIAQGHSEMDLPPLPAATADLLRQLQERMADRPTVAGRKPAKG
jgi:anti-sigma factor RsiW